MLEKHLIRNKKTAWWRFFYFYRFAWFFSASDVQVEVWHVSCSVPSQLRLSMGRSYAVDRYLLRCLRTPLKQTTGCLWRHARCHAFGGGFLLTRVPTFALQVVAWSIKAAILRLNILLFLSLMTLCFARSPYHCYSLPSFRISVIA